ncbi:MAG: hypothetical protein ACQSGP_27560 [Frankia sp.]
MPFGSDYPRLDGSVNPVSYIDERARPDDLARTITDGSLAALMKVPAAA